MTIIGLSGWLHERDTSDRGALLRLVLLILPLGSFSASRAAAADSPATVRVTKDLPAAPAWAPVAIATVDLVVVTVMVVRGFDVRLVLLVGALPLFLATGTMKAMLAKMVAEMANPNTVVPIGSAMGFAFVLRTTGCDRHLVELLLVPIRRVRMLLVPGGIAAGYLINSTIVSQAGTASVLGPILLAPAPGRRARPGTGRRGAAAGLVDGRRAVQPRRRRDAEALRVDRT